MQKILKNLGRKDDMLSYKEPVLGIGSLLTRDKQEFSVELSMKVTYCLFFQDYKSGYFSGVATATSSAAMTRRCRGLTPRTTRRWTSASRLNTKVRAGFEAWPSTDRCI
jgi:hypothetical protein